MTRSGSVLIPEESLIALDDEVRARLHADGRDNPDPAHSVYGTDFCRLVLFTEYTDLLPNSVNEDRLSIGYNRVYWVHRFVKRYQSAHGFDAGMEQYAFQTIEWLDGQPLNVDWSVVEVILKQAESD